MHSKLLLISYNFYPNSIAGSLRFSHLSKYLENKGFDISVLTINKNKIVTKDPNLIHGGKIYRTGIYPSLPLKYDKLLIRKYRRFLFKFLPIDSQVGWVIPALFKAISLVKKKKFDKIIVTGPPFSSFLIAYFCSVLFNVDLIVDYRDPWFIWDNYSSFFRAKIKLRKVNFFIERKILKHAWKIVFNTKRTLQSYLKQFPDIENKSFVISNAFNEKKIITEKKINSEKIIILYAGIFYGERKLNYLYKPLKRIFEEKIIDRNKLEIHVFGKVPKDDWELLKDYSLSDIVTEHNRVEYEKILSFMKGADILYLAQGYDHRHCVPYKIIDYLSVKKPILALTPSKSATHELMEQVDCGEAPEISSENEIYTALVKLINKKKYTFNGVEKYTWTNITNEYASILKN